MAKCGGLRICELGKKDDDTGDMTICGYREGTTRKIRGKPVRCSVENAESSGKTVSEYRMVHVIECSRYIEKTERKLASVRRHRIDDHEEKGVLF